MESAVLREDAHIGVWHAYFGIIIGVEAEAGCIIIPGIGNCGDKVRSTLSAHNNIHFLYAFAIYDHMLFPSCLPTAVQPTQYLLLPCHRRLPCPIPPILFSNRIDPHKRNNDLCASSPLKSLFPPCGAEDMAIGLSPLP